MGKTLESKHTDLQHRILKNASKTCKVKKRDKNQLKRRISDVDLNEPPIKKPNKPEENKFNTNNILVNINSCLYLHNEENRMDDLFYEDESKASYLNFVCNDFYFAIIEEIALEGLDGITLEAFFKRLSIRAKPLVILNENLKEIFWKIICDNPSFNFYELPEERNELIICDNIEIEPVHADIYTTKIIANPEVQGSCSTFETRVNVAEFVKNMTYKEVQIKYGQKLVIVADQKLRKLLLWGEADPLVELQNVDYAILEKIGRTRKFGELTQGKHSISSTFNMDHRSVFHYQKRLVANRFITKQFFFLKSSMPEHQASRIGRLVHLRRFYKKVRTYYVMLAHKFVDILKSRPGHRLPLEELKQFPDYHSYLKLFKVYDFRKIVRTDVLYPYRQIYPDAPESMCLKKSTKTEKTVRCYELVRPSINVSAVWNCDSEEDVDDEEDDENEESEVTGSKIFNLELFREVYMFIFDQGKKGCTPADILKSINVDANSLRMVIKKLLGKRVIHIKIITLAKTRKLLYYAKCLDNDNTNSVSSLLEYQPCAKVSVHVMKLIETQKAALEKMKENAVENDNSKQTFSKISTLTKHLIPKNKNFRYLISELNNMEIKTEAIKEHIKRPLEKPTKSLKLKFLNINLNANNFQMIIPETLEIKNLSINFEQHYEQQYNFNKILKLILFKLALGEISIKDLLTRFISIRNPKQLQPTTQFEKLTPKQDTDRKPCDKSLQFMGENPVMIYNINEDNCNITLTVSTPPAEVNYETTYPIKNDLTEKTINRIQTILDVINEKKIVEEILNVMKVIVNKELKEGYDKKIDKKSLLRLLKKLVEEGYIKIFKMSMSDARTNKVTYFIAHPTTASDDPIIQLRCEQLKWKYFETASSSQIKLQNQIKSEENSEKTPEDALKVAHFQESDILESLKEMNEINQSSNDGKAFELTYVPFTTYGCKPKFVRMRILHEFLFYIIYEYKNPRTPLDNDEVKQLFKNYMINLSEEDLKNMPDIFVEEISWKMFIPGLPEHKGWPDGWAFLCDVILRLPISVLCKIHPVTLKIPELADILNHPIKRFYLIKDLPLNVRNGVLLKRRYVASMRTILKGLAFCGLVQLGPQRGKELDKLFFYLNRITNLLDTTTTTPSYNLIEDKKYKEIKFYFNNQNDLENYWYNLYTICLNTKLNRREAGKIITYIDESARPELTIALRAKLPSEALDFDNGTVYGDRRGAAGLDSSLWSHISRNWYTLKSSKQKRADNTEIQGLEQEKFDKISTKNVTYQNLCTNSNKVYLHKPKKIKKTPKIAQKPNKPNKRHQKLEKKLKKYKKKKREHHDKIDIAIMKKNGAMMKIPWNKNEDYHLMLCKAVHLFLSARSLKKVQVPMVVYRDLLHRMCPESKNKTSGACKRRMTNLANQYDYIEKNVYTILKIDEISKYLSPLIRMLTEDEKFKLSENQAKVAFVIIMSYIYKNQDKIHTMLLGDSTNYLEQADLNYIEKNVMELEQKNTKFVDPLNEDDVKKEVIKSVIHSSLASKNQPNWAFHFFKIYQRYPDDLVHLAVEELYSSQIISASKKMHEKSILSIPFKLSNHYICYQYATFNVKTALWAFQTFLRINENNLNNINFALQFVETMKYGQMLSVNEIFTYYNKLQFNLDLPQHTVILNPKILDHTDLIEELALRLQIHLMKTCDVEQDQEEEDGEGNIERYERKSVETKQVPTLEEIKEGMLQMSETNEERRVPYITDLFSLLNKDTFSELNTDEKTLEQLKSHFVTQYPKLKEVIVERLNDFQHHIVTAFIEKNATNLKLWDSVAKDIKCVPNQSSLEKVLNELNIDENGGSSLIKEIVEFVKAKEVLGATCQELGETFLRDSTISLVEAVKILINAGILFRMGICKITLVHYEFVSSWVVETSENVLSEEEMERYKNNKEEIPWNNTLRVKVTPWTKINGALNKEVLTQCLCNVLSHCLDYPMIPFPSLCERFCFIRPVDVFYLLELLEKLGCVNLIFYENVEVNLFSEWSIVEKRNGIFMDDFSCIVIEATSVAMTCLGSFLREE